MKSKWSTNTLVASALLAVWPVGGALAQDAKAAAVQAKVAELKQSLAANKTALQQYTWVETTEISLKGEVKKTQRKECHYGADGKVVKTDMADASPAPAAPEGGGGRRAGRGGGALKKKIVENKVDEMKDYMGDVAALVKEYVPPDGEKIRAAAQNGKVAFDKETTPGVAELAITDYQLPKDRLAISFNGATKQLAAVNINSYLGKEKDTVTLAVRFAALPDGANYPAETMLVAAAKQIQVKITNTGYRK